MTIPKFEDLFDDVLKLLCDEKEYKTRDVKEIISANLNLTDNERNQVHSNGESVIFTNIAWAISTLKKANYIESKRRGYVNITQLGLDESNNHIDMNYLIKIPEVKNWLDGKSGEILQIRTLTLSRFDEDSKSLSNTVNFLSDILFNERNGHYHFKKQSINLIGRTLVLFKYNGNLIAKGIITDKVNEQITLNGDEYNGYYIFEEGSVEIFTTPVNLNELKKYCPEVKNINKDVIISIDYLNNIFEMIEKHVENDDLNNSSEIIRNYLTENNFGSLENSDLDDMFVKFRREFGPEVLNGLEGVDLINKIFAHDSDKSTLCYKLEHSKEYMRGGIGGGSAYKFYLFKKNDTGEWNSGSSKKPKTLSENEAIEVGTKIRDALVNGAYHIENMTLESVYDYIQLEYDLFDIFRDCIAKPTASWIHKYYVLTFPEKFIDIHAENMKADFLHKFHIEPLEGYYAKDALFYLLAQNSNVKLYSLLDKRIVDLFYKSDNLWEHLDESKLVKLDSTLTHVKPFESNLKRNIIYFGAPGTGKSYNLNRDIGDFNFERVTFHPDYSYANFVGTYKPVPENSTVTYRYVPGPFMRILKSALDNPDKPYVLVIEEINRANVAAVFGDVFQLLDRNSDDESAYPINASEDMKTYINKDQIKLPSNLFIWATMNSADQGVYPMDTAFKRRWDFKYFTINHDDDKIKDTYVMLNGVKVCWNRLRKLINDELLSYKINEDKLIGPFFAFNEYHNQEIPSDVFSDVFKNKIIMYLFEDAARSRRNDLFSGARQSNMNITYSRICEEFDENGLSIFCDNIKNHFITDED